MMVIGHCDDGDDDEDDGGDEHYMMTGDLPGSLVTPGVPCGHNIGEAVAGAKSRNGRRSHNKNGAN